MPIEFKIALYSLLAGLGIAVVGMALPLRCPNIPPFILDIMIYGGLVIAIGSVLLISYELIIRPRIKREAKVITLTMIIVGILLIVAAVVYHFSDKNPRLKNESKAEKSEAHFKLAFKEAPKPYLNHNKPGR